MPSRAEQDAKACFVENELADLLIAATRGYVRTCEYFTSSGGEFVIVTAYSATDRGDFLVNITGDSLWVITKDVMKAVAKRFG